MTLRDEHLQQALRHAPDHDLAPEASTRRAVLDYAARSIESRQNWLLRLWQAPSWQLAGLSAAMAALLVVVVIWHKPPELPIQVASAPADAVQRKADASSVGAIAKPDAGSASASANVSANVSPSVSTPMVVAQAEPRAGRRQADEKAKGMALDQAAPAAPAEKLVIASAPEAEAVLQVGRNEAAPAAMKERAFPSESGAAAPAAAPLVMAERSDALSKQEADKAVPEKKAAMADAAKPETRAKVASAPQQTAGALAGAGVSELAAARVRGAENAARDIHAGTLRILSLDKSLPSSKQLIDEVTGYRVELVGDPNPSVAFVAEVEAYNQVMRDWHASGGAKK